MGKEKHISTRVAAKWKWAELAQVLGTKPPPRKPQGRVIPFHLDKDRFKGAIHDDTDAEILGALAGTGLQGGSGRALEPVRQD